MDSTPTFPLPTHTHRVAEWSAAWPALSLHAIFYHKAYQWHPPTNTHTHTRLLTASHSLHPPSPSALVADALVHTHTSPRVDPCLLLWPSLFFGIKEAEGKKKKKTRREREGWERVRDGGRPNTFLSPIKFPPSQWKHLRLSDWRKCPHLCGWSILSLSWPSGWWWSEKASSTLGEIAHYNLRKYQDWARC